MKFLLGIVFGILLLAALAAAVIFTGSFNTAATVPPGKLEKSIAQFALDRSAARRAPNRRNPLPASPETLRAGLHEYRENCLICHGAPGVDPGEISAGLNPGAPDLTVPRVQGRSDGQLFWITSEGVRMTGMPAFGPTHDEKEIWATIAFLRHLPELSDAEVAELRGGSAAAEAPEPAAPAAAGPTPSPR